MKNNICLVYCHTLSFLLHPTEILYTCSVKYPATGKIYFGCNGEYSKNIEPKINCYSNGLPCPELETWKKNNHEKNFEECFGEDRKGKYPPAQCYEPRKPKECDQYDPSETKFWKMDWGKSNTGCIESTNDVIYPNSNCKSSENIREGKSFNIEATMNDECWGMMAEGFEEGPNIESYQFCRKGDCVLMRVSRLSRPNNATFDYSGWQIDYPTCRYKN